MATALQESGTGFEILVGGQRESLDYVVNRHRSWKQIHVEQGRFMDLESGEPSIQTLKWLKQMEDEEGFRETLRQFLNGDGYNVDQETREWAQRELERIAAEDERAK